MFPYKKLCLSALPLILNFPVYASSQGTYVVMLNDSNVSSPMSRSTRPSSMEERVNQVLQRLNAEPKPLSARSLQENQPPIAVATSNLYELTGAGSISLSGAQSRDPNGDLLTFEWKQLSPSSPLADIASPTTEETTVRFAEIAADTT